MRKAILETPFEKAKQRVDEHFSVERADDCVWLNDSRGQKRITHLTKDQAKRVGKHLISISKARKLGAKDIKPRKKRNLFSGEEDVSNVHSYKPGDWVEPVHDSDYRTTGHVLATRSHEVLLRDDEGKYTWHPSSEYYKPTNVKDLNPYLPKHIKKSRKLGAKDIKPRKKRIGFESFIDRQLQKERKSDPLHPIHRIRIREVYGQDGLDYYDRLIQKQGISHNEAMGSLEEAHQRHSTGVGTAITKYGQAVSHAAKVNQFSRLFPVKPLQKEKFKFVVKEKKESEKTPVEKDFDKIRKFQMDRRMVT